MRRTGIQCIVDRSLVDSQELVVDLDLIGDFESVADIVAFILGELGIEAVGAAIFSELYGAVLGPTTPMEGIALLRGDRWHLMAESIGQLTVTNPSPAESRYGIVQSDGPQAGRVLWLRSEDRVVVGDSGWASGRCLPVPGATRSATIRVADGRLICDGAAAHVGPGGTFTVAGSSFRILATEDALGLYSPEGTYGIAQPSTGRVIPRGRPAIELPSAPSDRAGSVPWPLAAVLGGVITGAILAVVFDRLVFLWLIAGGVVVGLIGYGQQVFRARRERLAEKKRYGDEKSAALARAKELSDRESSLLSEQSPRLPKVLELIETKYPGFWASVPGDSAYLRLSAGSTSQAPSTIYRGANASLLSEIKSEHDMRDVSAVIDLCSEHLGIFGPREEVWLFANSLIVQMLGRHSPSNCEVAVLLPDLGAAELKLLDWLKWPGSVRTAGARGRTAQGLSCDDLLQGLLTRFEAQEVRSDGASPRTVLVISESSVYTPSLLSRLMAASHGLVRVLWVGTRRQSAILELTVLLEINDGQVKVEAGVLPWKKATWGYGKDPQAHREWIVAQTSGEAPRTGGFAAAGRLLGMVHDRRHGSVDTVVPRQVSLREVVAMLPAGTDSARDGLVLALGRTASGIASVALQGSESHLLLGGTTGAGKSQLLQSMLTAAVYRYSPQELSILLVDFKGEAAILPFEGVPHVIGSLSNLRPAEVSRMLEFLEAEVLRRQGLFRDARAGDYIHYRRLGQNLPRLLVAFDEYSALIEANPKYLSRVVEIARMGRSLGVHLLLATQRPSRDVVTPAISANLGVRISLRTASPEDSELIVGASICASIPKDLHGRGFLGVAAEPLVEFQAAHAGSTAGDHQAARSVDRLSLRGGHGAAASGSAPAPGARTDLDVVLDEVRGRRVPDVTGARRLWPDLTQAETFEPYEEGGLARVGWRDSPSDIEVTDLVQFELDLSSRSPLFVGEAGSGKSSGLASVACAVQARVERTVWWSAEDPGLGVHHVYPGDLQTVALELLRLQRAVDAGERLCVTLDDIPLILELMGSPDATSNEAQALFHSLRSGRARGTVSFAGSARSQSALVGSLRALFGDVVQLRAAPGDDRYDGRAQDLRDGYALVERQGVRVRLVEGVPTGSTAHEGASTLGLRDLVTNSSLQTGLNFQGPLLAIGKPRSGKSALIREWLKSRGSERPVVVSWSRSSLATLDGCEHISIDDVATMDLEAGTALLLEKCRSSSMLCVDLQRHAGVDKVYRMLVGVYEAGLVERLVVECEPSHASALFRLSPDMCYSALSLATSRDALALGWFPTPDTRMRNWIPGPSTGAFFTSDGSDLGLVGR